MESAAFHILQNVKNFRLILAFLNLGLSHQTKHKNYLFLANV